MNREAERQRLVEMLQEASLKAGEHIRDITKKVLLEKGSFSSKEDIDRRNIYEMEADHLLDNGIVVPPCKVGDVVYKVYDIESVHRQILELEVLMIEVGSERKVCLKTTKKHRYNFDKATFEDFGKTVFTSREEALTKLKEGKNNG